MFRWLFHILIFATVVVVVRAPAWLGLIAYLKVEFIMGF